MRHVTMLAAAVALSAASAAEAAPQTLKVTELLGEAHALRNAKRHVKDGGPSDDAPWRRLKKGSVVQVGEAVRTGPKTRLELALPDGSRLRLGAKSKVTLDQGRFRKKTRNVSITMWVGRIWAKVAKRFGSESKFEVETANAVAGVRGTSFTVIANTDLSALVRVYSGTVGVRKNDGPKPGFRTRARVQVPGPSRVDQKQWEEIVATQMKQVTITKLGKIMPAEDFEDQGEELEWAMWNQKRDKAL